MAETPTPSTAPTASDNSFDVLVIGAGPGGYVCAIRAAQLGLKTACIDMEARFGGTCLRIGCIPSKALLDASEKLYLAQHHFAGMGIKVDGASVDLPAMMARKDKIVETLTGGVSALMKKNRIEKIVGSAKFGSPTTVEVTGPDGPRSISAKHIIIATGSTVVQLPFMKFDGTRIISSDQGIALPKVPATMVVTGLSGGDRVGTGFGLGTAGHESHRAGNASAIGGGER